MAGTNYMQLARETPPNSRGQAMSGAQLAAYQRDVKQGAARAKIRYPLCMRARASLAYDRQ